MAGPATLLQNRDQKNEDQQNKEDNKVNQHVRNQQNGNQPASPDDNDQSNFKDGDATMAVNTAANEIINATNYAGIQRHLESETLLTAPLSPQDGDAY